MKFVFYHTGFKISPLVAGGLCRHSQSTGEHAEPLYSHGSSPSTGRENWLRDPPGHLPHPGRQPAPSQSVGHGSPFALSARLTRAKDEAPAQAASMVRAAPAPAAITLCLRFSADLVKAAAAALIIGAILSVTGQHADLSASVLQGFQCIPASDLPAADILAFARGLQNKTAELSGAQVGRGRNGGCKPHGAQQGTGSRGGAGVKGVSLPWH
ncbi:uncharacterized protein ACIBXB_004640 [Morphnus guianensis]